MTDLLKAIADYVDTSRPGYAILLTGEWGSGKTFFYKQEVSRKIIELGKKPLYISLYGVNNDAEIGKRIFFAKHPWLGTKYLDKITDFFSVGKSALNIAKGIQLPEFKFDYIAWSDFEEDYILIFDDLERINLDICEVLGFINTFLEHKNLKVVIIANQAELPKKFFKIKEKIIGLTFEFQPDISNVYDEIVKNDIEGKEYIEFLRNNKDKIKNLLEKTNNLNFRILKQSLYSFKKIFSTLKKEGEKDSFCFSTLLFLLAISFEIKKGNNEIKNCLERMEVTEQIFLNLQLGDKKENQFLQDFLDKYFFNPPEYELAFSKSILDYSLTGFFIEENLRKEINHTEESEDVLLALIQDFHSGKIYSLEHKGFINKKNELLKNVSDGNLSIHLYPLFYSYLIPFAKEEVIEPMEELDLIFEEGIYKAYSKIKDEDLDYLLRVNKYSANNKLGHILAGFFDELRARKNKIIASQIFGLLLINFEEFKTEFHKIEESISIPLFNFYSPKILFNDICKLKNAELVSLRGLLHSRYGTINIGQFLSEDLKNLEKLKNYLSTYLEEKEPTLKKYHLNFLCDDLDNICSKLRT